VEADGLELLSCGPDFGALVAEAFGRFPDTQLASPQDEQRFGFQRLFSDVRVGRTIEDATSIARTQRPDLVVNEVADFVGPLIAAQLRVPNVTLGVGLVLADEWLQLAAGAVAKYWEAARVEPRADAGIYRTLYLNQWPRLVQRPLPERVCAVRDLRPDVFGATEQLPPDLEYLGADRPVIYVTFGTMFGDIPTLRTVVDGLLDLDADIVVTVGYSIDPAELDVDQPNVVVRSFIPQGALLDRCQLVVCHGGSGSVLGPLHYGAPLIVIPMGADQLENAERLAAAGVARTVAPTDLSADAVHKTARTIVADETFRHNARAVGDEIATMPTAPELVPVLEALRGTAP
jgi:UDP-N-acetylglucosamine:LPS N-acetylglucosamine transferase